MEFDIYGMIYETPCDTQVLVENAGDFGKVDVSTADSDPDSALLSIDEIDDEKSKEKRNLPHQQKKRFKGSINVRRKKTVGTSCIKCSHNLGCYF